MNVPFDFDTISGAERIVYIRPVAVADLPADVQAQAAGLSQLYALHDANGARLALVKDRWMALVLARQNALDPVPLH